MPLQGRVVRLEGGLDLVTPKSLVKPGSFLDCLNYEYIDEAGPRRTEGYRMFDGAHIPAEEELYFLRSDDPSSDITGLANKAGIYLFNALSSTTVPFGIYVGSWQNGSLDERYIVYIRLNPEYEPTINGAVFTEPVLIANFGFYTLVGPPAKLSSFTGTLPSVTPFIPEFPAEHQLSSRNMAGYWRRINKVMSTCGVDQANGPYPMSTYNRSLGSTMPGSARTISGLHYFNDKAYAVADTLQMRVTSTGSVKEIKVGDILYSDTADSTFGNLVGLVTQVNKYSGNWLDAGGVQAYVDYYDITNRESVTESIGTHTTQDVWRAPFNSGFVDRSSTGVTPILRLQRDPSQQYGAYEERRTPNSNHTRAMLLRSFTEKVAADAQMVAHIKLVGGSTTVNFTTPPVIQITGGGGYGCTAEAIISDTGSLLAVRVTNPGRGYTTAPTVAYSGGGGTYTGVLTAYLMDYRHSGWKEINTGWVIPFQNGDSQSDYLTKVDRGRRATSQNTTYSSTSYTATPRFVMTGLDFSGAVTQAASAGWASTTNPWADAVTAVDADSIGWGVRALNFTSSGSSQTLGFTNFNGIQNTLPENAIIRGITAKVYWVTSGTGFNTTSSSNIPTCKMRGALFKTSANEDSPAARTETRLGNIEEVAILPSIVNGSAQTTTFGGSANLWGTDLKYQDIIDPRFGFALDIFITRAGGYSWTDFAWAIDKIELTIQYQDPTIKYYFSDGSGNIVSADLVDYVITGGSFRNRDAKGFLQVANLTQYATTALVATANRTIDTGWSMYTSSGLVGKVAEASGRMSFNSLDGSYSMSQENSRYQFLQANFYAADDWESIYGVSGAGRAWQFDGQYFQRIYAYNPSQTDADTLDKPRHIEKLGDRLALGYATGLVDLSVNNQPTNFDGLFGAAEIGVGDRITGFSNLQGQTLAVFCENKVMGIRDSGGFSLTTLVPTSGAIEYTVKSIGDRVIFTGNRGISTLDQSQKYGDFEGSRLSYAVNPWLLPRLTTRGTGVSGTAALSGIVEAYVVRSKNQYRIWFKDGIQLVMTLVGPEQTPVFTFMQYFVPRHGVIQDEYISGRIAPLGLCSVVDSSGKERVLFSLDLWGSQETTGGENLLTGALALAGFVYEAEQGWSYVCNNKAVAIPAYILTNHVFGDNPFMKWSMRKMRVEGASRGNADLCASVNHDYNYPVPGVNKQVDFSIPDADAIGLPTDYGAGSDMVNVRDTGRVLNLRIDNYTSSNFNSGWSLTGPDGNTLRGTTSPMPPHYLQLLMLQFEEGGMDA